MAGKGDHLDTPYGGEKSVGLVESTARVVSVSCPSDYTAVSFLFSTFLRGGLRVVDNFVWVLGLEFWAVLAAEGPFGCGLDSGAGLAPLYFPFLTVF